MYEYLSIIMNVHYVLVCMNVCNKCMYVYKYTSVSIFVCASLFIRMCLHRYAYVWVYGMV